MEIATGLGLAALSFCLLVAGGILIRRGLETLFGDPPPPCARGSRELTFGRDKIG